MHKNKTQLYDSLKKIERKKLTFETISGYVLGILVWQNYNSEDPYHKFEQLYKFSGNWIPGWKKWMSNNLKKKGILKDGIKKG